MYKIINNIYPKTTTKTTFGSKPLFGCQALCLEHLKSQNTVFPHNMVQFINTEENLLEFQIEKLRADDLAICKKPKFIIITSNHGIANGQIELLEKPVQIFFNINKAMSAKEVSEDAAFDCTPSQKISHPAICDYPHFEIGALKTKNTKSKQRIYLYEDDYVLFYKDPTPKSRIGAQLLANATDVIVQKSKTAGYDGYEFITVADYHASKAAPQPA